MNENALKEIMDLDYERPLDTDFKDPRIEGLKNAIDIKGMKILEVGTLDGFHALELTKLGAFVTVTDVRPSNLQRAMYRFFAHNMSIHCCLLEAEDMGTRIPIDNFDMIFHSGVFYHLSDPIQHLHDIAPLSKYILLETHIANYDKYEAVIDKHGYNGTIYPEGNWEDLRAAKDKNSSFWLAKDELKRLIEDCGLRIQYTIYEDQANPHGTRVCYLLRRV